MSVSIAQTPVTVDSNITTPAVTITSTTAGDVIVVLALMGAPSGVISSCSDNATGGTNSYASAAVAATDSGAGNSTDIWYATTTRGGVTIVDPILSQSGAVTVYVLRGGAVLGPVAHLDSQSSTTTPNGPQVVCTSQSVVLTCIMGNATVGTIRSGGFTRDAVVETNGGGVASLTETVPATEQCGWNWSPASPTCSSAVSFNNGAAGDTVTQGQNFSVKII